MSRGLGTLERAIIEALAEGPLITGELLLRVYAVPPRSDGVVYAADVTASQYSSVRRALVTLRRRGLVFQLTRTSSGQAMWANRDHAKPYAKRMLEAFGARGFRKSQRDLLELALEDL